MIVPADLSSVETADLDTTGIARSPTSPGSRYNSRRGSNSIPKEARESVKQRDSFELLAGKDALERLSEESSPSQRAKDTSAAAAEDSLGSFSQKNPAAEAPAPLPKDFRWEDMTSEALDMHALAGQAEEPVLEQIWNDAFLTYNRAGSSEAPSPQPQAELAPLRAEFPPRVTADFDAAADAAEPRALHVVIDIMDNDVPAEDNRDPEFSELLSETMLFILMMILFAAATVFMVYSYRAAQRAKLREAMLDGVPGSMDGNSNAVLMEDGDPTSDWVRVALFASGALVAVVLVKRAALRN